jgi:hypothetical protein
LHIKGYRTDGSGGPCKKLHSRMQFCLQQLGKHTGMEWVCLYDCYYASLGRCSCCVNQSKVQAGSRLYSTKHSIA